MFDSIKLFSEAAAVWERRIFSQITRKGDQRKVDNPKKTFCFSLFQKALFHYVLITILNCPHNHHHKNILILHIQKPFINRVEINSILVY